MPAVDVVSGKGREREDAVSTFAFGGNNCALVFSRLPGDPHRRHRRRRPRSRHGPRGLSGLRAARARRVEGWALRPGAPDPRSASPTSTRNSSPPRPSAAGPPGPRGRRRETRARRRERDRFTASPSSSARAARASTPLAATAALSKPRADQPDGVSQHGPQRRRGTDFHATGVTGSTTLVQTGLRATGGRARRGVARGGPADAVPRAASTRSLMMHHALAACAASRDHAGRSTAAPTEVCSPGRGAVVLERLEDARKRRPPARRAPRYGRASSPARPSPTVRLRRLRRDARRARPRRRRRIRHRVSSRQCRPRR